MTRINLVRPDDLADQHLFAEWREIKMVPAALRRSLVTKSKQEILRLIPKTFTLNTGHVTFFFDKINFLYDRYVKLTEELENRGYNLTAHDMDEIFYKDIPSEFREIEWQPSAAEIQISVDRILTRLNEKLDWYKFNGSSVPPGYFEALYQLYLDTLVDVV